MPDPVDGLILDLLEWIGKGGRPYSEVMEAWRTSCPRLPVWEEANRLGFLDQRHDTLRGTTIHVSVLGLEHLHCMRTRIAVAGQTATAAVQTAENTHLT